MRVNYPHKHSGQAAIICGTAPCLHKEFEIVRNVLPEAKVIAVNDAASIIEAAFIASVHEEKLSYFKVPAWFNFRHELPKTGSQKIQKHMIFDKNIDPEKVEGMIDFRSLKRRS